MTKYIAEAEIPPRLSDITEDGLEIFAPYLMNRILRRYNTTMEQDIREAGLSVPRLRVLAALAAQGPQTVNNLAIYAVSEQSSTSRLVEQMIDEGLVSRSVSDKDNRVRIVALTPLGRTKFEEMFPLMQMAEANMMAGLSNAERAMLLEMLRKILHNIRQTPI